MNESDNSTDNSHNHTKDQVEGGKSVVPALVLAVAHLDITHVHDRRNNAHQRRSANSTSDTNDSGQIVEDDTDSHAREHQQHRHQHLNTVGYT